jgi:hypothetical protein
VLWGGCFVEITIITQNFHASVGKIQFYVSVFLLVIFGLLFSIIHFNFCAKLFKFLLADSDFHVSAFQIPIFKFPFSRFRFSGFNFLSLLRLFAVARVCWQVSTFTLLLRKLSAETNSDFQIVIICVISAQLPHNVPALKAGWG